MIRECGSFWQRLFPFIPGQVNGTGEDEVMEWGGGVVVVVVEESLRLDLSREA